MLTDPDKTNLTPVEYEHSPNLVPLLNQLGLSLLISTYQAGKVITVGVHNDAADIHFYHFEQAMGIARTPTGLMVGSRRQFWYLVGNPSLASKIKPEGKYDVVFLTRSSHFTGPIMGHEMDWGNQQLWFANTLFSCLCVIQPEFNFVPKWTPPFISQLASEDRCHLNGMVLENGEPRYVTALGETDTPAGWRENKASGGCLMEVRSNQILLRGLCMPHSPRMFQNQLYFLDSGKGHLCLYDASSHLPTVVAAMNGYTRGMEIWGHYAFIGLSRVRETNVFGGIPIAERREHLRCGLAIVDLRTGQIAGFLHFKSGVEEIFEVKVIPGYRCPMLSGPLPDVDQTDPIWLAPPLKVGTSKPVTS